MENCKQGLTDLFVNTFRSVIKAEQRWIKDYMPQDLSLSEINVIHKINKTEKTMTELAALLDITVSSLTTSIDKLVKKGYVDRKRDTSDRRMVFVYLTANGKKVSDIHDNFRRAMVDEIVGYLSPSDMTVFVEIVDRLREFFSRPSFDADISKFEEENKA